MKPSSRIDIAIVDDQRMFLDGIDSWLSSVSDRFDVRIKAASYAELRAHEGFPTSVVVLDADLRDGTRLDDRVRELSAEGVFVIVVSTFSDSAVARGALAAGAVGYISKSESAEEIAEAITAAVEGRDYLTPQVTALLLESSELSTPPLSAQEQRVMILYATGLPMKVVATTMGLSQDTVATYLKRIRSKYVAVGIRLDSRVDFYLHAKTHDSAI